MGVSWLECIANLNSELERKCKTMKHSSLSRSGSIAHRALRCKLGACRRQLGAGEVGDVVRAGDRTHLRPAEADRPVIPLPGPTDALPRANRARSLALSTGGHSPPSSCTAAAPSGLRHPAPARCRTTEDDDPGRVWLAACSSTRPVGCRIRVLGFMVHPLGQALEERGNRPGSAGASASAWAYAWENAQTQEITFTQPNSV
jgi:hypothetical protein